MFMATSSIEAAMDRACGVRQPPTAPGFTERQGQYLAFIDAYTRVSGRPPAEADLQRHFGVSAPSVHQMADSDDVGRAFRTDEVGHLFRPKSAGRSDRCRPGWRVARRSVVISPWRCRSGQAAMAWAAFLRRESPRS